MAASTSVVIFQKNLQDLVKGIRAQKRDLSQYISQSIADIKSELRSNDPFTKAEAIRKLTYLQMMGYDVSWASFSVLEVMSLPRFAHKRIGYLGANQTFTDSTDILLLTTNHFKKEFQSHNTYDVSLAINSLSNISNKDLARDTMSDVVALMNHPNPFIRKKAVSAMYKLYVKYPQGLRVTFDQLKEKLNDPDASVVSCAVNVICELARKNPKNYLAMAPYFFRLLTTSSNNWMLIKVVKLLGSLVPEESRLARKLLEPLAMIIQNTTAKSLQFECIHTLILSLPYTKREDGSDARNLPAILKLAHEYLSSFIRDEDPNLKYLGLVGLLGLLGSYPKEVVEHRESILTCLKDDDITIRSKALELLSGIVTRKSFMNLVEHLLKYVTIADGSYREELISKILFMGRRDKYTMIPDFAWYLHILETLTHIYGSHGSEVADQFVEIAIRVESVRPYCVEMLLGVILDKELRLGCSKTTVSEVLFAAAWVIGEYSAILTSIMLDEGEDGFWFDGPNNEEYHSNFVNQPLHVLTIHALLNQASLPPNVLCCYMQAVVKIFTRACSDCPMEQVAEILSVLRTNLPSFLESPYPEIQERSSSFHRVLREFNLWPDDARDTHAPSITGAVITVGDMDAAQRCKTTKILCALLNEEFYNVHSKAQRKVPVPEGLDLECAFNVDSLNDLISMVDEPIGAISFLPEDRIKEKPAAPKLSQDDARLSSILGQTTAYSDVLDPPSLAKIERVIDKTFYLHHSESDEENVEMSAKEKKRRKKKSKQVVNVVDVGPTGVEDEEEDKVFRTVDSEKETLESIDIRTPLRADEALPVYKHREATQDASARSEKQHEKRRSKKNKSVVETAVVEEGDLIGMEWDSKDSKKSVPASVPQVPAAPVHAPAAVNDISVPKKAVWLTLYSDAKMSVQYTPVVHGDTLTIIFQTFNLTSLPLSAEYRAQGSVLQLAKSIPAEGTQNSQMQLAGRPDSISNNSLSGTMHIAVESLLGQENYSSNVPLLIPIAAFFKSHKISEDEYQQVFNSASATMDIDIEAPSTSKLCKLIMRFMNGHEVQTKGKTILSAARLGDCVILCSMKKNKETSCVTISMRCSGSRDKSALQALLSSIAESFRNLVM